MQLEPIRTTKLSVAIVLRDITQPDKFLIVQRPGDDPDMAGHWGLPAVTLRPGELLEDGARRVCQQKLGCSAAPIRLVGSMFQERNSYDLLLFDIEMMLDRSTAPDVLAATGSGTYYTAQKWSAQPTDLAPSAKLGSCCSSIFLTDLGIMQRQEWVRSLQGSTLVA